MNKYVSVTKQFFKYFGAALVGYIVDFSTLIILHDVFHIHYIVSAAAGFILGLIVLYFISGKYVFGVSKINSRSKEFLLFAGIGLVGLVILTLLMALFVDIFEINYIISKILATIAVYIWNFIGRRSLYEER